MDDLISKLGQHGLIDEMGNIILEKYEEAAYQSVERATFETFFGDAFPNVTYEKLVGAHSFTWNGEQITKTGEELGYKSCFDKWLELGIL